MNICWVSNIWRFWIFQDCQYARVLNFQGYTAFTYIVNMTGFWICIGCNYRKVVSIPGFLICQASVYAMVMQWSEYVWINCSDCGFWICLIKVSQGFEFASYSKQARAQNMEKVTQGAEYAWISMAEYIWVNKSSEYGWILNVSDAA